MDDGDVRIRNHVYRRFVELGRAPTFAELREELGDEVQAALGRLHAAHALVLEPDGTEIRMANPFSAVPTPYRVEAGGRSWYGNCAWDAFGIPAALHVDGHVSSACLDCGEQIEIECRLEGGGALIREHRVENAFGGGGLRCAHGWKVHPREHQRNEIECPRQGDCPARPNLL